MGDGVSLLIDEHETRPAETLSNKLTLSFPEQIWRYSRSFVPLNGSEPERSMYNKTPADHTSAGFPYGFLSTTSGLMKCGVPIRPGTKKKIPKRIQRKISNDGINNHKSLHRKEKIEEKRQDDDEPSMTKTNVKRYQLHLSRNIDNQPFKIERLIQKITLKLKPEYL